MENRKSLTVTVKRSEIFYFLTIIPFFPIDYFTFFVPAIATIYSYARYLVILILLYRLIKFKKNLNIIIIIGLLYCIEAIIASYLSDITIIRSLSYGVDLLGVCLIVQDGLFFNRDSFIRGTLLFFELLVYANFFYFIINPNGYILSGRRTDYYLLGNYNTVLRKVFPGLIIGAIYAFHSKGRITARFLIMSLAVLIFLVANNAVTAIIGIVIFLLGLILYSIFKRNVIFKYEYFLIVSVALTIIFVIIGNFTFFETFITDILGRNMTLTSRTIIWNQAMVAIPKKIIFGYGQGDDDYFRSIISGVAAHNIYLDTLLFGGLIGMILLGFTVFFVWRKIRACRGSNSAAPVIFDCAFCSIFIMWNFEPYGSLNELYKIFMIFTMAYFCDYFVEYCSPLRNAVQKMRKTSFNLTEDKQSVLQKDIETDD